MLVTLSGWREKIAGKKQTPMPLYQAIYYVHSTYVQTYLCIAISKNHAGIANATPNRCSTGSATR